MVMKRIRSRAISVALLGIASIAIAAASPNPHASEKIGTVRQVYDGALFPDIQVNTFRNIDRLFPTRSVRRGSVVSPLQVQGMTMVVVSHEMGFARAAADRMIFIDEGLIVEEATPEDLYNNPQHERTKLFLSKILH